MRLIYPSICIALLYSFQLRSQVGINTDMPNATFEVMKGEDLVPPGVIAPRISSEELSTLGYLYTEAQSGAIVYITTPFPGTDEKFKLVNAPGYYYYNFPRSIWIPFGGDTQPWNNVDLATTATSNTQNIYHRGNVVIGNSVIDKNAQLEIASSSKGILIPRLTNSERNTINDPANGLIIFNTTTNCLNYFSTDANKWLSLCGDFGPANLNLVNCDSPTGPKGSFKAGVNTTGNSGNAYTVVINVNEPGSYSIEVNTDNGYSFRKTGTATHTGEYTIVCEAQGTPMREGSDIPTITINGVSYTTNCSLPPITVEPASAKVTINDCSSLTPVGDYYSNELLSSSKNYIDIPVTVTGEGSVILKTNLENGFSFSSNSVTVNPSTNTIRLYASRAPINTGITSFTIEGYSCSFNVNVTSNLGSFKKPADRCSSILAKNPNAADGFYFIKGGTDSYKTYCDMTGGGWTLVKSYSEKAALNSGTKWTVNAGFNVNDPTNVITTETGEVDLTAFRLPLSVVQSIASENKYKFLIKQDINAAPSKDAWAVDNYSINTVFSGGNPTTGDYTSVGYTTEGKLFSYSLTKPSTQNRTHIYNGTSYNNAYGFWNQVFYAGYYGVWGGASRSTTETLTYTTPDGGTDVVYPYYINDLWTLYTPENQLNHHIGKCRVENNSSSAEGPDYGGLSSCSGNFSYRTPHSFNNGEGRIIQSYIK
ncbi:hypothetical protein ETU08_04160 [Apibacter muscae]|uniref:Fibrinogen C-terminal domain-containing protein n=1 Tax=Apibacter muscae TaxID=2509004 RepID=A0A563DG06_9FLAO|nr:fibrinogen-like YCDxxxxGGGW domain-containing protein [Apibacter muscae]TWP29125.1 hypothetical protein ETU09_04600 [Apibacter muscae]TWP30294.1 hypothetical protein ETU08_04160 [Apibacter muscae]